MLLKVIKWCLIMPMCIYGGYWAFKGFLTALGEADDVCKQVDREYLEKHGDPIKPEWWVNIVLSLAFVIVIWMLFTIYFWQTGDNIDIMLLN